LFAPSSPVRHPEVAAQDAKLGCPVRAQDVARREPPATSGSRSARDGQLRAGSSRRASTIASTLPNATPTIVSAACPLAYAVAGG
jgi:hypothetical protein